MTHIHLHWAEQDGATRKARKPRMSYFLFAGTLDRDLAWIEPKPKSVLAHLLLPGLPAPKLHKDVETAKKWCELHICQWFEQALALSGAVEIDDSTERRDALDAAAA